MMKGYRLQVLGYSLCLLFLLSTVTCNLSTVRAADSTPSADVKAKLEALKQEIASKAAKLKQEINKKLTNKAYVGVVKSKTSTSITLAAKSGSKIVSVNQDTLYQDTSTSKSKPATLQAIKEEAFIAALGDVDDTGVLAARKIVILPTTNYQPKTILWGQVISISDQLITIKDRTPKNQTIAVGSQTNLNQGNNEISLSRVENGHHIIVSGVKNKNEILEASLVYVIPSLTASPSATIKSATPSGKKKI